MQLRRITTSGSWIPEIDGLRFVAIVSVVLFHLCGQLTARSAHSFLIQPRYELLFRMVNLGDRGVELFFVISGYILARPFLRQYRLEGKPVKLGSYFLRRVTRLEPPYILSLLIYAAGLLVYTHQSFRELGPHLLASMFYVHSLAFGDISTINFVTWSLEIEIQFYLCAPLLGQIYRLQNTVVRRGVIVLLIVAGSVYHLTAQGRWTDLLPYFLHYFMTGFLLADILDGKSPLRRHVGWDVVSVVVWPMIFLLPRSLMTLTLLPILILPVYLAAFYGPASRWFFRRPWVALTGGMCYSIYLMHLFIISVFFKVTKHFAVFEDFLLNYLSQVLTLGVAVIGFSTVYFVLVERPCMDPEWPRKLWVWAGGRKRVGTAV